MTSQERYYRRAYSMFNELNECYKNGFDINRTKEFVNNCQKDFFYNKEVYFQKINSLKLTILIALMGLNKEVIEKANIFDNYKNTDQANSYAKNYNTSLINEKLNNKVRNTDFDSWLAIKKDSAKSNNNNKIIETIRNGLLHSNFTLDNYLADSFTNIKIKSYYESVIYNDIFFDFIFAYFSNVSTMGLVDQCSFVYTSYNKKIKNESELKEALNEYYEMSINYHMDDYNGNNSLNQDIQRLIGKYQVSGEKIFKLLKEKGIGDDKIKYRYLTEISKKRIFATISNRYNDSFYKMDKEKQNTIISFTCERLFNSKSQIGNWLSHFYYILHRAYGGSANIDTDFLLNDEYCYDPNYALSLIKGYIILYRLKNSDFDEVNYADVDIDVFNSIYPTSKHLGKDTENDYFADSIRKLGVNYPNESYIVRYKRVCCEIIRDALAHSNANIVDTNLGYSLFEFHDFDKSTGKSRILYMTFEDFNKFLDSKAFEPKYCYQNNKEKSFVRCK